MQSEVLLREHAGLAEERQRLAERVASAEAALRAERAELEVERDRLQQQQQQQQLPQQQRGQAETDSANIEPRALQLVAAEAAINSTTAEKHSVASPEAPASPITGDSAPNTVSTTAVLPGNVVQTAALLLAQQLLEPLRQQSASSEQQHDHQQSLSPASLADSFNTLATATATATAAAAKARQSRLTPDDYPESQADRGEENEFEEAHSADVSFEAFSPPRRKAPEVPETVDRGRSSSSSSTSSGSKSRERSPFARRHRRHPDSSVHVVKEEDTRDPLEAPTPLATHASTSTDFVATPPRLDAASAVSSGAEVKQDKSQLPSLFERSLSPPIISKIAQRRQQERHGKAYDDPSQGNQIGSIADLFPADHPDDLDDGSTRPLTSPSSPTEHVQVSEGEKWRERMKEEQMVANKLLANQSMTWVSSPSSAFLSPPAVKDGKEDARARMKAYNDRYRSAFLGKPVGMANLEPTDEERSPGQTSEDYGQARMENTEVTDDTQSQAVPEPKFKYLKKRPPNALGRAGHVRKVKGSVSQSESVARLYGQHFVTRSKIEEARLQYV